MMTSGLSTAVANRQLGVQAALGAPDTSGNRPFFKRLAAVRCAFRCVASIMIRSGLPPLPASSAKILLNTPRRLQRTNRIDCRLLAGRCRAERRATQPAVSITKTIALTIRRIIHPRNPMREWKIPFNPTHLNPRQQKQISHGEASQPPPMNQPFHAQARTLIGPEPRQQKLFAVRRTAPRGSLMRRFRGRIRTEDQNGPSRSD